MQGVRAVIETKGRLEITAATNIGLRRSSNEDSIVVGRWIGFGDDASHSVSHDASADVLLGVADGLGGHRGGAVASRMVIEGLAARANDLMVGRSEFMTAAISAIDDNLRLRASSEPSLSGMGSTLAMAVVTANAISVLNIGDSRIYLSQSIDELRQISIDDIPQDRTEGGPVHRRSHRITQALGGPGLRRSPLRPHTYDVAVSMPWTLLLCSDGLTDYVDEAVLKECIALPSCRANDLVKLALAGGGGDNVSVILARCAEQSSQQ